MAVKVKCDHYLALTTLYEDAELATADSIAADTAALIARLKKSRVSPQKGYLIAQIINTAFSYCPLCGEDVNGKAEKIIDVIFEHGGEENGKPA